MPLLNSLATPYAEALLQVSESRKETDTVAEQVRDLLAIWNDSAELREAMASPVLEPEAKKAALAGLFGSQLTESLQNLLKLLADRQRIAVLDSVLIRFLELYRQSRNITLAKVTSATPLQSLALLNGAFIVGEAERMGARVAREAPADDAARIDRAYRLAYGRPPTVAEGARAAAFLVGQAVDHVAAGRGADEAAAAALADLCHMLLASNEFLHVE